MELIGGMLLGGLLFGGSKCHCAECIKTRRRADRTYARWYKKNKGTSVSVSPSGFTSPSVSTSPSTYL